MTTRQHQEDMVNGFMYKFCGCGFSCLTAYNTKLCDHFNSGLQFTYDNALKFIFLPLSLYESHIQLDFINALDAQTHEFSMLDIPI